MPLPNTRLIHPHFEQHHRPVAAGQMTGECVIERPSSAPPVWDDVLGRDVPAPPDVLYEGPCRYQYLSPAGQPIVADQTTPLADIRVTVPVSAIVYQANDLVRLTATTTNPDLQGRRLVVVAVSGSTISWQRDLTCQLRQPTTR